MTTEAPTEQAAVEAPTQQVKEETSAPDNGAAPQPAEAAALTTNALKAGDQAGSDMKLLAACNSNDSQDKAEAQ